jgi:transposase-like protein
MAADAQNPIFTDDNAAREALEAVRWPNGPVCPHCGNVDQDMIAKVEGTKRSHRPGLYYCNECKGQFTVTVGTVFERSKISLSKWWLAVHLLNSSKKGVSAHQIHRMLGVTYKTAWFMMHRIREAMRTGGLEPLGGSGKIVETDETYHGPVAKARTKTTSGRAFTKRGSGPANKRPIVALVERGGRVRTFHVPVADQASVQKIVKDNIARESRLHTDESRLYHGVDQHFEAHKRVKHSAKEYARRDLVAHNDDETEFYFESVHTNSAERYFSIFKRGMNGVYQHCAEKHLHRYLAEFDFRYNHRIRLGYNDGERAALAMKGIEGKRLMYRPTR